MKMSTHFGNLVSRKTHTKETKKSHILSILGTLLKLLFFIFLGKTNPFHERFILKTPLKAGKFAAGGSETRTIVRAVVARGRTGRRHRRGSRAWFSRAPLCFGSSTLHPSTCFNRASPKQTIRSTCRFGLPRSRDTQCRRNPSTTHHPPPPPPARAHGKTAPVNNEK